MRRLPNVYPADTSTWPNSEGTFDVGAADTGAKILMRNLTPLNLRLDFYNGSTDVLSAWEHNVWPLDGDSPTIGWTIDPDSPSVIAPPSNVVYLTLFNSTEKVPGTYPVFSVLQTSSGSTTGTGGGSTNQLINTGNPAGQNVITVNSTAAVGSTVTLSTEGLFQLLVTITAALVNAIKTQATDPILQLGALTHLVEVLGNLKVDGTLESVGAFTADALISAKGGMQLPNNVALSALDAATVSHNILNVAANNHVQILPAGQGIDQLDGSGNILLRTTSTAVVCNKVLQLPNNVAHQSADSGGTQRDMLYGDASNLTHLRSLAAGAQVTFEDSAGAQVGWFDGGGGGCKNGTFQAPTMQQTGAVANGSTISGIRFRAFTSVPSGISTLTHNFGFVPDVAFFACGQAANTNPGTATNSVYNWLANTCTLNIAAAVNGVLVYIKA